MIFAIKLLNVDFIESLWLKILPVSIYFCFLHSHLHGQGCWTDGCSDLLKLQLNQRLKSRSVMTISSNSPASPRDSRHYLEFTSIFTDMKCSGTVESSISIFELSQFCAQNSLYCLTND